MTLIPRVARRLFPVPNTPDRRRPRRARLMPTLEGLERRLVLTSTLASTTVAGGSVNQVLYNVINDVQLGGLKVLSTNGFPQAPPLQYVLLKDGTTDFALVSYSNMNPTKDLTTFSTLALSAGDGNHVLTSSTAVAEPASGVAPDGPGQTLSKDPFTLKLKGHPDDFPAQGYLYVRASKGNYIIQYGSVSDTTDGNTTFANCTITGSDGALAGSPFGDVVNASAAIVESVAATAGQTTSLNATEQAVAASTEFTLTVVSTAGFATPSAQKPGFFLLYYSDGSLAVVRYTGIAANSNGGYDLQHCTTTTGGTIGAYGHTSGPAANVKWTSAEPISFRFTNNTAQNPVYVSIAGQQVDTRTKAITYGYLAPQSSNGAPDLGKPWQFQTLAGISQVPSYTLFAKGSLAGATQTLLIPNDPYARLDSVRIIFSVAKPPVIAIQDGKPSFPVASGANLGINFDFVEFTERSAPNDGILFINTTQVDQVGLPFTMQTTPQDPVKNNGVGITVTRPDLFTQYSKYVQQQFGTLADKDTKAKDALTAFQGLSTPNRLLNPSRAITNAEDAGGTSTFSTYFDAALTAFFKNYIDAGQTFRLQRDGYYFSGQTVESFSPPAYGTQATNSGSELLIPPGGNAPTSLLFPVGSAISGPGVPAGAKVTGTSVDAGKVTHVQYTPAGTSGSGSYAFTLPGTYTVLQLKQTDANGTVIPGGQTYQIYAPYFSNGSAAPGGFPVSTPLAAAPPWLAPQSAGLMVFGNLGVFADGTGQAAYNQISGDGATAQILLDIENTIVSAFNRGVANFVAPGTDVTDAWNQSANFYKPPDATGSNWSNFYAGFLHNGTVSITAPGSTVGLAYGFAYDDQGGNDPTLTSAATSVAITLNAVVAPPKPTSSLRFTAVPTGIKAASGLALLALSLRGAIPKNHYTLVLQRLVNGKATKVGNPVSLVSDVLGRLRTSLKALVRLKPGTYRVVIQNAEYTPFTQISKWFTLK